MSALGAPILPSHLGSIVENNEPITEHGQFWLMDNEQRRLWGTLYINESNKGTLETFGSLIDPKREGCHNIVGQIRSGQEFVTLIDCFPTNTNNWILSGNDEPDWSRQTCLMNRVVEGLGFKEGEEFAFEQAYLDISTLTKWANTNLVKWEPDDAKTRPIRRMIAIEDREDEVTTVSYGGEDVKISVVFKPKEAFQHHGVIMSYQAEDHCYLRLERTDGSKMSLESIMSFSWALLDLLCICCNETPIVSNISVLMERDSPHPAKVYVPMKGRDTEKRTNRTYVALDLEAIGGMEGVAQWIQVKERYGESVALLTSNWYNSKAYNEDKLSRMYTAVEGLLSRKKGRKRAKMTAAELAKFASEAIPGFASIIKRNPEEWAKEVKEIRDKKLSHLDPSSTLVTDGRTMHVMTNVIYVAGASFLLGEVGLGENRISKYVKGCSQIMLMSDR